MTLEQLIENGKWQDMDSAPRDREILALCKDTGECFVVQWMKEISDDSEMWVAARAWDKDYGQITIGCKPDKWMTLPDERLAQVAEVLLEAMYWYRDRPLYSDHAVEVLKQCQAIASGGDDA